MSDPLAFFAADGSSSESEDETAAGQKESHQDKPSDPTQDGKDKLPSPDTLFKSIGRPSFLDNPHKNVINWDRFVKSSESEEPNIHQSGNYAAIPPPSSLGNSSTATPGGSKLTRSILGSGVVEFSSPPVEYANNSNVSDSSAPTSGTGPTGTKRPQESSEASVTEPDCGGPGSSKKIKTDNFRLKEKRKRDLGQSSRGKSYVEEEKRILRQQFGSDEIPS